MQCEDARAEMTAYLAEEVGRETRTRLEAHLAGCAPCRANLEAFRETWAALEALPAPGPSPDLEARVLAQVRAEAIPRRAGHRLRPIRVPIAALIAAFVSIGLSRLLPYEAAARLCQETLGGLFRAGGVSDPVGAFVAGVVYAVLPVLLLSLVTARLNSHRPLAGGVCTGALFVVVLSPYVLAVCSALPAGFVAGLLAGLAAGAVAGGSGGFWLGRRLVLVGASA